jgi:dienelactone hydrolase
MGPSRTGHQTSGWRRLATALAAPITLALAIPACTSSTSTLAEHASVSVQPETSTADQAVHIKVGGLRVAQQATVQVSSIDWGGVRWTSSATYRADDSGGIDLDQAASVSGSYQGVSGMGLIWSMRQASPAPGRASDDPDYFWSPTSSNTFNVMVSIGGRIVASTSFRRAYSAVPATVQRESLAADGFIGEFVHPAGGSDRRPAVLVLGGSEGGLSSGLLDGLLASQGYAALGVAYFGLPGLPSTLANIPLEYFARALRWLAGQPGVNPAKIAVLGVSRGSEAAQLLGVHYPNLVHAVIASVPSDAAICSYPACSGPAWTLGGKPLPYTKDFDNPSPADDPAAVIQDQRINGPVFLDCAEADKTWSSCAYARAILSRLDTYHDRWTHVLYAYPGAGHLVGDFLPYEPAGSVEISQMVPSYAAIQEAEPGLWQHLLTFLAAFAASSS